MAGEAPTVFGDGQQTRDYVFVEDVVEANHRALNAAQGGTYNVGTGIETSVNDLFVKLKQHVGSTLEAKYVAARPGEVQRSALSYARIREDLGWRPAVGLEKGLRETVAWFNSRI